MFFLKILYIRFLDRHVRQDISELVFEQIFTGKVSVVADRNKPLIEKLHHPIHDTRRKLRIIVFITY